MMSGPGFSRRALIGTGIAATGSLALSAGGLGRGRQNDTEVWVAKQQIAELRQLYGFATDLIGSAESASIEEGRSIYRRIFTADAAIGAANVESVTGPDAWVDVVLGALKVFASTQHLIGTQYVDVHSLPDADGQGGAASMRSYLQAWHAKADGELWLFIGTYHDEASYSAEHGWQISKMVLEQVSEDRRQLGS